MKLLSILIPVFSGREGLLYFTLQSMLRQKIDINFEMYIINDGVESQHLDSIINEFKNDLNIQYIFTGQRNINPENKIYWRTAAFALNIGIKKCKGDLLLFNEPEVFHLGNEYLNKLTSPHSVQDKIATHPSQVHTDTSVLLNLVRDGRVPSKEFIYSKIDVKNNYQPFFNYSLCIKKKHIMDIDGFDEKYLGQCWEDGNFYNRLVRSGINFISVKEIEAIHLFHERVNTPNHLYNKMLYEEDEKNQVIRCNQGINWGENLWKNIF